MNQDSDKNDNRRDGDRNRSFGRRDDGRTHKPAGGGDSRPRSSGPRNNDTDRPRFNRDERNERTAGADGRRDSGAGDRPRSNAFRPSDRSRDERPARPGGSPFGSRDRQDSARSRSDRPGGPPRPSFGRDRNDSDQNRNTESRPRFERDDKPRFDRSERPRTGAGPRDDKPRFNRDTERSRSTDSDQRRSRFDNDRRTSRNDERPRFERRDDKPRSNRSDERDRPNERPRFERRDDSAPTNRDPKQTSDTPRRGMDGPRLDGPHPFDRDGKSDRRSEEARPRFSRDSNDRSRPAGGSQGRSDKAPFKRVGGFSREADERNRENWSSPDKHNSRDGGAEPRNDRQTRSSESGSRNTRFTPEQRKDSGERRTGFFVKAPNYELEQRRQQQRPTGAEPRAARPRTDKYADAAAKTRQDNNDRDEKPTRTPAGEPGTTRLNRYIANSGVCSRREADELIARGDISVNGNVVTEMGFRVKEGDMVKYGTKALTPERFVYVLLNKPKDYITTTEDPEERKTVMELVADAGNFRMYPVGRLDRKTTGLLLLTNDGELADKLTHPSNEVRKIYQVELDKPITDEHFTALKKGMDLEDGPIKPDALSIVTPDAYVVGIEIHSGRNHIVRRMFESLGYEVTKLDRTAYAGLTKKELPRGKWRFLDPKEVVKLKYLS